jgi:hypothetical protein
MNMNLSSQVRDVLAPLDPAADGRLVTVADRDADLRRIMATAAPGPVPRPRRGLLVAVAAATALVLVAVVGYQVVPLPQPAYAATPAALAYAGGSGTAATILTEIADRAEAAPGPTRTGDFEHLVTLSWDLWTQVDGEQVRSAIVPTRKESWRGPDDSGRIVVGHDEPQFTSKSDRWLWRLHGSPGADDEQRAEDYPAGRFPAMWPGQPPVNGFEAWLSIGHPASNGPAETLVAVTDLARERVLSPAVRADILRTVAKLPGIKYDGEVTDRAGRHGLAFSLVSDYGGLPTRYTLIVDPAGGALLGYEQMLTTRAGKLDVRVPAVIGYETYATSEYSPAPA